MINWKSYYKKIPAQIKIGSSIYRIFWVNGYPKDKKQLGESNFQNEKYITININQPIKEAVHTYWHEILHVLSNEYEAGLTEKQVVALEKGLKVLLEDGNMFKKEELNGKKRRY